MCLLRIERILFVSWGARSSLIKYEYKWIREENQTNCFVTNKLMRRTIIPFFFLISFGPYVRSVCEREGEWCVHCTIATTTTTKTYGSGVVEIFSYGQMIDVFMTERKSKQMCPPFITYTAFPWRRLVHRRHTVRVNGIWKWNELREWNNATQWNVKLVIILRPEQ